MAKKKSTGWGMIGAWSFYVGILVAFLVGIFSSTPIPGEAAAVVLLILGLIVGLLNISDKEITPFLIASIALMIAATIATVVPYAWIPRVLANIVVFVLPAAVIGSLKAIWTLAKN